MSDSTRLCGPIALFSLGGHSHDHDVAPQSPQLFQGAAKSTGAVSLGRQRKGRGAEAALSSAEVFPTPLWKVTSTKSLPKVGT